MSGERVDSDLNLQSAFANSHDAVFPDASLHVSFHGISFLSDLSFFLSPRMTDDINARACRVSYSEFSYSQDYTFHTPRRDKGNLFAFTTGPSFSVKLFCKAFLRIARSLESQCEYQMCLM